MKIESTLILNREDLRPHRKDKTFEQIEPSDFKCVLGPNSPIITHGIVMFIDDTNMSTKILKNRYGDDGTTFLRSKLQEVKKKVDDILENL